ncbi:uncharacterized protein [Amphiura filiformis]|uniref:uncharacterized protein isoform X2 n=1 Tax=Amphiura filiformis TaxID=82378 RepID=UPI003B225385
MKSYRPYGVTWKRDGFRNENEFTFRSVISRNSYPKKLIFNYVTRRPTSGMLYFLLILLFMSTFGFWTIVGLSINGASLGQHKLKSRYDWSVDMSDAANLFEIRPVKEATIDNSSTEYDFLVNRHHRSKQDTLKTNKHVVSHTVKVDKNIIEPAVEVCPENDIPHLVGAAKSLNLSPVLMQTVEQELFGKSLVNVTTLINETNYFLTKINRTNPEQYTNSCIQLKEIKKCQKMFPTSITTQSIPVSSYTYMSGGHWKPTDCIPRWKVAIIIPYRNRSIHLPILLHYLTPFLQRQLLEFHFFVVEQMNDLLFNKAMIMNIAILESLNFTKWDCFVFHDVDHIPLNDHNYYGCNGMPRHFMSGSDQWDNKLPYDSIFGGVTGFTPEQLFNINGFPNVYWGWGSEDDEIFERARQVGKYNITRTRDPIGLYNIIKHHHQSAPKNQIKDDLFNHFLPRVPFDGFSNLMYDEPVITMRPLYTHIAVNIQNLTIPGYTEPHPATKLLKTSK